MNHKTVDELLKRLDLHGTQSFQLSDIVSIAPSVFDDDAMIGLRYLR